MDAQTSVITHNVDDKEQEKVTKEDFIQEQETAKGMTPVRILVRKKRSSLKKNLLQY